MFSRSSSRFILVGFLSFFTSQLRFILLHVRLLSTYLDLTLTYDDVVMSRTRAAQWKSVDVELPVLIVINLRLFAV